MIANFVGKRLKARGIHVAATPDIEHGHLDIGDGHIVAEQERTCDNGLQGFEGLAHSSNGRRAYSLVSVLIVGVAELAAALRPCEG
ncbi:MAG: hypothetical protein ACPGQV_19500 [Alphaproteobacteria bacterium]